MPTTVGPNTKGEENLVFGYDLGDVANSYKGEPTTNVALADMTAFTKDNGCTVTATGELFQGQPVYRVYFPAGTLPRIRFNFAYTTGQTWNGSIYYKVIQSGDYMPQFYFREAGFGSSYISTGLDSTEWTRANLNYTFSSNGTSMFLLYRSVGTSTLPVYIDFAMPQVELNSHATQFVAGTRSATQGLIDLTGNSTIDLTNVSFDSNAQMTFDGTNDTISVTSYSAIELVDNVSIEYVYMRLSTDPILDVIANKYHSTGWELFCQTGNTFALAGRNGDGTYYVTTNPAYTIENNKYYHLVAMKEGLSWRLYVNGELYAYLTAGSVGTWSNTGILQLGGEGNGYYPNMQLPVFKIYNRILTASEVQSNYNAIKGRFNI